MTWLDSIADSVVTNLSKPGRQWRTEEPGVLQSMGLQKIRHDLTNEQQEQPQSSSYLAISIVNGRNYLTHLEAAGFIF